MHLSEIKEFRESPHQNWVKRLSELNIRHVEQLGSLLAAPDGRYAAGVGLACRSIRYREVVEPVLKDRIGLSLSNPFKVGPGHKAALLTREHNSMGYSAGERDPFWQAAFDTALPDPPKPATPPAAPAETTPAPLPSTATVDGSQDFKVRFQGRRGTCVAFAAVGMYYLIGLRASASGVDLSPQYLYFRAKYEDNVADIDEDGTSIEGGPASAQRHGCCPG